MRAENGSRSRDLKAVARTASLTGEFRGCWHPEGLARQVRKLPAVVAARCVQLAGQYGECTVEDRHASRVPTSLDGNDYNHRITTHVMTGTVAAEARVPLQCKRASPAGEQEFRHLAEAVPPVWSRASSVAMAAGSSWKSKI
jgi:hypothetical protein